ncbi:VOC family protein [Granulicella arctica]|uniref:VOC family protein n=1 Tax=Granulicella arctica TaxID=940613 RepID=UPI0021E0C9A5|nr:VOC family protein [Granulicella arctica]
MANPFVHLELNTPDAPAAKDFYTKLFGWTFQEHNMGDGMTYNSFSTDKGPGGGIFTVPEAPTDWLPYVGVEDIKVATDKAVSLGATLIKGPHQVPNMGWFSILADPTGATIAIWEPTSQA